MERQMIQCPYCKKEFVLDDVLSKPIEDRFRKQFAVELERQKAAIQEEMKKSVEAETNLKLKDLIAQNTEKAKQLEDMAARELELRKKQRDLEAQVKSVDLEIARRLDEERKAVAEQVTRKVLEDHQLKDAEKEKQLAGLRKQIEELQRKSAQGPVQVQGVVWEESVESVLAREWPEDQFEPIATGARGADILQKVFTRDGKPCGTIYHECKNVKNWSNDWIPKLKEDQRGIKADIAVIITRTLPRDIVNFGQLDGVWVTDGESFIGLVTALRLTLIEVARTRAAAVGKGKKMEMLYHYLSGTEFRQRIEAIVESFATMKKDLDAERKVMQSHWSKREKQIARIVENTAGLYGDIQGISGATLPQIEQLDLQALTDASGDGGTAG